MAGAPCDLLRLLLISATVLGGTHAAHWMLVHERSVWRYWDNGSLADAADDSWQRLNYNDAGWSRGAGVFGYGARANEVTTALSAKHDNEWQYTVYFRTGFSVRLDVLKAWQSDNGTLLAARMLVDDGAIVTVNGVTVYAINLPAKTPPAYAQKSTERVGYQRTLLYTTTFRVPVDVLKPGMGDTSAGAAPIVEARKILQARLVSLNHK